MNYEEFKDRVKAEIKDYLNDDFLNTNVKVTETMKVNKVVDALMFENIPRMENASPSIPLNNLFKEYEETQDFQGVMRGIAGAIEEGVRTFDKTSILAELKSDRVKDNIFMTLVNTEQNKELLETVPHRSFEDLSIIYRWNVKNDSDGLYTNIVNNGFANTIGMNEEQLYNKAMENTKIIFPTVIQNMNDIIAEMMFGPDGPDDEIAEEIKATMEATPDEKSMYVITNSQKMFGASAMLYEEGLHELSEKIGTDLYILPSSVHEVIAISVNFGTPEELAAMVYEVNTEQVDLDERLSNQVYHYDKEARTLRLATDTINKSIADKTSEMEMAHEEIGRSR